MLGTIIVAILFLIVGGLTALVGYKVFRVLLPMVGLFTGFAAGFTGMQAVFGTGEVSFVLSVITAILVGLILALLSYAYFKLAIILTAALVGASLMSTGATAIGLQQDGFITFMLSLAGSIAAAIFVARYELDKDLVIVASAMAGTALILVGIFLLVSDLSLEELHANGVAKTFQEIVDKHFIWMLVWFGGVLTSILAQNLVAELDFYDDAYVLTK